MLQRIRNAVASEQSLQVGDLSWLDQIGIEPCGAGLISIKP